MMMAASAVVLLVWRIKLADWTIAVAAPIGAWMTALALFTGGVWGKPTWGAYWVWDGRTTSTLLQLFLYLGVIALRSSIAGEERAGRAAALLCLIGLPNIFVIKYSVTWWISMHQVSTFKLTEAPSMPPEMYLPLVVNVFGFYCFFAAVLLYALRLEVLRRERRTQWVRDWLQSSGAR
jgi:heme exporter protein C